MENRWYLIENLHSSGTSWGEDGALERVSQKKGVRLLKTFLVKESKKKLKKRMTKKKNGNSVTREIYPCADSSRGTD